MKNTNKQGLLRFINSYVIKLIKFNTYPAVKIFFSFSLFFLLTDIFDLFRISFLKNEFFLKFIFFSVLINLITNTIIFFCSHFNNWFATKINKVYSITTLNKYLLLDILQILFFLCLYFKLFFKFNEYFIWHQILLCFLLYFLCSIIIVNLFCYFKKFNYNHFFIIIDLL